MPKVEPHNDRLCPKYGEEVLPDENGNCSLCGAEITDEPTIKALSYEESVRLDPIGATQAELHSFCEWLQNVLADNTGLDGQTRLVKDKIIGGVIEKVKFHDLWT